MNVNILNINYLFARERLIVHKIKYHNLTNPNIIYTNYFLFILLLKLQDRSKAYPILPHHFRKKKGRGKIDNKRKR